MGFLFDVQEVSDPDLKTGDKARELIPPMGAIPEEFWKDKSNKWVMLINAILDSGAKVKKYSPKKGIDTDLALRHLGGILRSKDLLFPPHKISGSAYLLSLWFNDITYEKVIKPAYH